MRRRGFILGLSALVASPAIVRASSLMAIKVLPQPWTAQPWQLYAISQYSLFYGDPATLPDIKYADYLTAEWHYLTAEWQRRSPVVQMLGGAP